MSTTCSDAMDVSAIWRPIHPNEARGIGMAKVSCCGGDRDYSCLEAFGQPSVSAFDPRNGIFHSASAPAKPRTPNFSPGLPFYPVPLL